MLSQRFLPDLFVMVLALIAGPVLLWLKPVLRSTIIAGSALLLGGLIVTLLQATNHEEAFRWLMISGLAFAWALATVSATLLGLFFRLMPTPPVAPKRRKLLTLASGAVMAAPAAILGYGFLIGRRNFRMQEVDLAIPGLAPDLDGLRLVQLSDIHLSPFISRADVQWCVDMANEMRPQVALVTGDLITGVRDSIDDCLQELRRLKADAGVLGCMGNHELYVQGERYTAEAAARRGMRFLRSEQTSLRFGSAVLNVAGVDHQWEKGDYLPDAKALLRPGEFNLLLSHNPDVFPKAAEQGWDLTLSGHMHGGQINLELANENLNFMRLTTPYVYGTYRLDRSAIYVTRGIGTVGMPVRFGAPPEVALIRLRRA